MKLQTDSNRLATRMSDDRQIEGSLEIGWSKDVAATDAYLKLPHLTTAERTALSAEAGMVVYDTTLGKVMTYSAAGWGATDGTAAGSLDAAYNGGSAITVDAAVVALTSSLTTEAFSVTGNSVTTDQVVKIIGTGVTEGSVLHLEAVEATLTTGFYLAAYDGAVNDFTIGKYGATVIAGNAGTSVFTITAGNAVMTSGNLTLSSGNIDVTGTLAVSGTATLAAINNSGTITSQGVMIIDVDNAEAFLVRRNGDAADVFTIDTTSDAGDTNVLVTAGVTTGVAMAVNADTITTGAGLRVDVEAGTMTTGKAILVRDGTTSVFSVADDGATVIKGTAEGTAALTVTTGDILVSDGDITVSGGEVALTDGVTTTGSGLSLTSTVTTSTAGAFRVVGNSLTSGSLAVLTTSGTVTGIALDISAAGLTTGKVIDMSDLAAITTGKAIHIDATGVTQTSGILVHIDSAATAITGAGRLFLSDHTGATGTSAILNEFKTAANDETVLLELDAASLTTGVILDVIGTALTTGTAIDLGGLDGLTTGVAVNVVSNSSDTGAFKLINAKVDHASATGAIVAHFTHDAAAGTAVKIDTISTTGSALHIDNASGVQSDNTGLVLIDHGGNMASGSNIVRIAPTGTPVEGSIALEIVGASKTIQGLVVDVDTATQSGNLFTGAGVRSADKALIEVVANASGSNADSSVVRVEQTHTAGVSTVLALKQDDIDVPFITFETTVGVGNAIEAVGGKTLTTTHFVMVDIEGVGTRYFPVGTIA